MFEIDDLGEHLDDLYRFALAISRDADLAGDLVHDAIVRAIERREQFRNDAPLGAWLRRILHNLAIDRARRSSREVIVEEVEEKWQTDERVHGRSGGGGRTCRHSRGTRGCIGAAPVRIPTGGDSS
jgi:RNA polymerase sigma factor (sigma-70 family)